MSSVDRDLENRNLEAELSSPESGHAGVPVDAICTGCRKVGVKRVRLANVGVDPDVDSATLEAADLTSFKHVCYRCGSATWWNPVAVLSGLIDLEGGE